MTSFGGQVATPAGIREFPKLLSPPLLREFPSFEGGDRKILRLFIYRKPPAFPTSRVVTLAVRHRSMYR